MGWPAAAGSPTRSAPTKQRADSWRENPDSPVGRPPGGSRPCRRCSSASRRECAAARRPPVATRPSPATPEGLPVQASYSPPGSHSSEPGAGRCPSSLTASVLSTQASHSGEPSAGFAGAVLPGAGDAVVTAAVGDASGAAGSEWEHAAMMNAAVSGMTVSKKRMCSEVLATRMGAILRTLSRPAPKRLGELIESVQLRAATSSMCRSRSAGSSNTR